MWSQEEYAFTDFRELSHSNAWLHLHGNDFVNVCDTYICNGDIISVGFPFINMQWLCLCPINFVCNLHHRLECCFQLGVLTSVHSLCVCVCLFLRGVSLTDSQHLGLVLLFALILFSSLRVSVIMLHREITL